jgi:hypothetical protein
MMTHAGSPLIAIVGDIAANCLDGAKNGPEQAHMNPGRVDPQI